jgi:hypothetical protein
MFLNSRLDDLVFYKTFGVRIQKLKLTIKEKAIYKYNINSGHYKIRKSGE